MLNINLWHNFLEAFSSAVTNADRDRFALAWAGAKARTSFYKEMLTPLATSLGTLIEEPLETGRELFKVDFVFSRKSNEISVPLIFIETENNPDSAYHEVRKLVNLAVPLRVLITVSQWDEGGIWESRGGGNQNRLLAQWESVIQEHQKVWPRPGVVGILIGEWRPDRKFRFYGYGYGEGHRLAMPLGLTSGEILLESSVAYQDPRECLTRIAVQ
jgi:hypothetical protein